jgi:hypothetical protein
MYGKIGKPYWDDRPVAVVGSGPSLIDFDFDLLRGAHVLAVKASIFSIPWADAGFGIDMPRFNEWRDKLAAAQCRVYWAVRENELAEIGTPPLRNVTFLKRLAGESLSDDPGEVYDGGTNGFGAIQICLHKRARQIILFGFDYDAHNLHSGFLQSRLRNYQKQRSDWSNWAARFSVYLPYLTSRGITVLNACPQSAITCFEKVTLQDGVECLKTAT